MQFTEKQIQDKINAVIGDLWAIEFIECGSGYSYRRYMYYDNYEEAMKEHNDTNEENNSNSNNVSDYCIVAFQPVKVNWSVFLHSQDTPTTGTITTP